MPRTGFHSLLLAAALLAAFGCGPARSNDAHAPASHETKAGNPAEGHADAEPVAQQAPPSEPRQRTLAEHLKALQELDRPAPPDAAAAPGTEGHDPAADAPVASDAQGPHPVDQVPGQPGHVEEEAGHASPDAAQAPTDAAHAPADAAHAPADAAHAPADAAQAPTDAAHAPADAGHAPAEAGHAPAHPAQPPALAGVKAPADRPAAAGGPETGKPEDLDPYKLVRSLQFVQDAVVQGDHSAMDMQRFLLGVIDARLRQADQTVFDDPRNVDAALIYAMSGGNPATLDMLVIRDRFGNFDNEITTVLRAYLNGRAAATKTSLLDLVKIYQETTIGPYLALVAANVLAGLNEESSLGLFDWARLTAPGTLVEEAALRRSLSVAQHMGKVDRAIEYAALYARRFIRSPYAGQYADLLVDLLVDNYDRVGDARLDEVLTVMDRPRKREVYLRISRKAVIRGMLPLASFAAAKAEALMDPADSGPAAMADLYSSMAQVPTGEVVDAMAALDAVPEQQLSPRDKALRAAARQIAYDVLSKPDPASLTQATSPRIGPEAETGAGAVPAEEPVADAGGQSPLAAGAGEAPPSDGDVAADKEFQGYVSQHQKSLDEIDKLLKQGTGAAGT